MTEVPPGLDPSNTSRRTFELEATAHTLEGMLKEGHVGEFTLMCDEGPRLGGEGSAPTPLQYLLVGLAFWILTQLGRYGHMLKVEITRAKVRTRGRFMTVGSAIAGTIEGSCVGMEMELDVESSADREKVLHVMRQAEQGCYAMKALREPTEVAVVTTLNGESVSL